MFWSLKLALRAFLRSVPDPFAAPGIGVITRAKIQNETLKANLAGMLLANKYFEPFIGFVRRLPTSLRAFW